MTAPDPAAVQRRAHRKARLTILAMTLAGTVAVLVTLLALMSG